MIADGEIDFPRGGAPTLTPLEVRKIRTAAERDTLFEKNVEPLKKKKKKVLKTQDKEDLELEVLQLSEKIVDTFSFKYLVPDLLALGYVSKITLTDIVIGLPNGLSGYLNSSDLQLVLNELDVSQSDGESGDEENFGVIGVSEVFTVGQLVPVVIKSIFPDLKGYKKLLLNVLPSEVNSQLARKMIQNNMMLWGMITSVEDHGCLVSFGKKEFTGFLLTKKDSQRIGTMQWLSVTKVTNKVISLTTDRNHLQSSTVTDSKPHFNSLFPGQLVSFTVTEVFDAGVLGKLFKSFDVVIENLHLPNREEKAENLLKKKVKGRIIYVNPKVKQVGVSLLPDVVKFSKNIINNTSEYGEILEDCEVIKSGRGGFAVLMKMPDGNLGIVRKFNLSDEGVQKIGKKYSIGTKHKCRIIGYHTMENLYLLSMKISDIEKEFFRKQDLKPGMLVQGSVIRLESYGALINIAEHFKGLCPIMHLADIPLKHPEKKFFSDKEVLCRVLTNDLNKKRITLTCKKALVKTDLPVITSYGDVQVGDLVQGFVSSRQSYGVFVSFYNGVVAILPKSEILSPLNTSLDQMFPIGKVVQCKVIYADVTNQKMTVSTKLNTENTSDTKEETADNDVGKIISAKLVDSEKGIMKLRQKDTSYVYMRKSHLSDFPTLSEEWDTFLMESGDSMEFKDLTTVEVNSKNDKTFVSRKEIYQEMNKLTFDQLLVGSVHCGVVTHIMKYGVFVEISPGLKGLALTKFLSDDFLKDHIEFFTVGQSVIAKVTDINKDKKRFILSLKLSDVTTVEGDNGREEKSQSFQGQQLLFMYLSQRQKLVKAIKKSKNQQMKLLLSVDKEIILSKVTAVLEEGVMLSYEVDGVKIEGFIPKASKLDGEFEVGGTCQSLVVYVNLGKKMFIGYTDQNTILEFLKGKEKGKTFKHTYGMSIDCTVCYANKDVIVALMPQHHYNIVYMPTKKHLNDVNGCDLPINRKVIAQYSSSSEYGTIVTRVNKGGEYLKGGEKHEITVGSTVDAVVQNIKHHQLTVTLCDGKLQGRVYISHISDEIKEGQNPLKGFKVGEIIKGKVLGFRCFKSHRYLPLSHQNLTRSLIELSTRTSDLQSDGTVVDFKPKEAKDFKKGDQINCFVEKHTSRGVKVMVNPNTRAFIPYLLLTDDIQELRKRKKLFHLGGAYQAVVTEYKEENEHLSLSRIGDPDAMAKKNAVVCGRVAKVLRNGVLVALPNDKTGLVHLTEMCDTFIDNLLDEFKTKIDTFVRCKVLAVDIKNNHIDLSLRCSRITETKPIEEDEISTAFDRFIDGYDDIKEGDILRGFVKSSTKVGVFVSLSPSITGRVLIKNLSRYFIKDFLPLFPVGKVVKAKILNIDPTTNNIDLSLRGTDVNDVDPVPPPKRKSENNENEASPEKKRKIHGADDDEDGDESDEEQMMSEEESESSEDEEGNEKNVSKVASEKLKDVAHNLVLELGTSFDWGADNKHAENGHSSESDESSDDEKSEKNYIKKTKRQKRAAKKAEEDSLHKAELALLDTERELESAEDFDRLVLGSPNSSIVWVQYMAFHLHAAEVEKAIAVGRRALKTISFREEQEKLNVWVALLNLENSYGTKESLEMIFQEAIKVNEPKKIFFKLVDIYVKNDKKEEAEKLYQVMMKRFKTSKRVWTDYGWFLMLCGNIEEARKLLQRSMKSLPVRKHVATIVKFGMMEYKMGDAQRGGTIFESLLKNYPKRTDLWSIYIDMCIKQQDFEQVRNIFERAITLNLAAKKMKFIFKRYVTFEEQHGTKATVVEAQRKSDEYMDGQMFQEME